MANNAEVIRQFLLNHGLTPAQAAGVMGNIEVESGFNPTSYNSGEGAIGLVQWEGGRRQALQQFAAARGTSETDLNTQLEFMWHEWQTTESSAFAQIKSANTPQQAAVADDQFYERSSGSSRQARIDDAESIASGGSPVTAQSAGATKLTGNGAQVTPTRQDYEDALGDVAGLLQAVPELRGILKTAIAQGWDTNHFLSEVHQTKYWQQNNGATRQLIATKFSDPAQFQATINQARQIVAQQAQAEGVKLSRKQVRGLAVDYITKSWNSQGLANKIGTFYNGQADSGQAAQYQAQLEQMYSEYGLPIDQARMDNRVGRLLSGQVTMDAFQHNVQQSAKSLYPSIAAQIDGGMTVKDIADPYIQTMANLLEINPDTLSLQTPLIRKALQGTVTTTNGKSTASSTPLWQFEQQVRQDPRWWNTNNAHSAVADIVTNIGRDWGFIG